MNKRFYIIELVGEEEDLEDTVSQLEEILKVNKTFGLRKATLKKYEPVQE